MKKNVIRLLFALVALLTSTSMLAENKLSISQYAVEDDGYIFAVMMENESNVSALQFDLSVPEALEVVRSYKDGKMLDYVYANDERLNNSQQFYCVSNSKHDYFKCAVFALRNDTFIGTLGPVAFFKVRGKDNTFDFTKPIEGLKLENIIMSTYDGEKLPCDESWGGDVTLNPEIIVSSSFDSVVVNPGMTFALPFVFTNSENVQGLQMDVQLPAGFTLSGSFVNSDRVSVNGKASVIAEDKATNTYRIMLVDLSGAYAVRNTGSGLLFTGEVTAPENIAEGASIVIKNVVASAGSSVYPGEGSTISIVDGSEAYNTANAEIAALQSALDAAVAEIAEDCPDVKDNFKGEAIQAAIDALQQAVDAAYVDGTLPANYETLMAPVETIKADIAKLVVDAKAAQEAAEKEAAEKAEAERKANNLAAYNADLAALDALNASYRRIVAAIQAEFPEYESVSEELTVRNALDDAKAEVEKAYKAVADAGEYDYKLDAEGLEAMINKLYDDAKERAANAELTRQQENEGAYNLQMAAIEAVRGEAETALALIKEEYNNYDPTDDMIAILAALDKAEADAKAEREAVKDAGNYSYVFDAAAVRAMIDEMLKRAEEAGAVEGIEAEVEDGNVVIFTLDGKRHANPVHGEVNIFVRKNGKTSKVMVD